MALHMLEVEFRLRVIAGEDFIIVHHNSRYLETLVVGSTLVVINYQRQIVSLLLI